MPQPINDASETMPPRWPARMALAQQVRTTQLAGKAWPRTPYGPDGMAGIGDRCSDCGVQRGQLHVPLLCVVERCPCCLGQALTCLCRGTDR